MTDYRVPRRLGGAVLNGALSQAMDSLTTGVILVGFALQLGASNLMIGIVGAIPYAANLFMLASIAMVGRWRDRRRVYVVAAAFGRIALAGGLLVPLIHDRSRALALLIVVMLLRYCSGAVATGALNSWLRDSVPGRTLGRFMSRRMFVMALVEAGTALGVALMLDAWRHLRPGSLDYAFATLYGIGAALGLAAVAVATRMPEPRLRDLPGVGTALSWRELRAPLADRNYRQLIAFTSAWNFAANLATPFFAVYMLTALAWPLASVIAVVLVGQLATAAALRTLGRHADEYGNKTVLGFASTTFILCFVGWTFTSMPGPWALTVPLVVALHVAMGVATAGVNLASNNIALKLAPDDRATSFLAINTLVNSLAAGAAPLLGGLTADWFAARRFSIDLSWASPSGITRIPTLDVAGWDFFFLIAAIVGLYSLHRLSTVQEAGSYPPRVIVRELMQDAGRVLRSVSTVDGLRDVVTTPLVMLQNLLRRPG